MTGQDWVIIGAGWLALAIIHVGVLWDQHHTTRRVDRHRSELAKLHKRLLHVEAAQRGLPTTTHAPMPRVGRRLEPVPPRPVALASGMVVATSTRYECSPAEADRTLRLARPPALTDVAGAIVTAGRPLTRAAIAEQLGRDVRTEIREQLLAGALTMVRTHDSDPAYWPTRTPAGAQP